MGNKKYSSGNLTASWRRLMILFYKNHAVTFLKFIIFLILLFLLSKTLLKRTETRLIHEDEVTFIERGKFFDWYYQRDFSRKEWQEFESYDVPKFAELFYGLSLRITNKSTVINYLSSINFYEKNILYAGRWRTEQTRNMCCEFDDLPAEIKQKAEPILVGRNVSVYLFAIPSLVLIFLIGLKVQSYIFGISSMMLIGSNTLFFDYMTVSMGDSPLWFFSLLFLYISFFYINHLKKQSLNFFISLLLGLIAGLATATKLNGGILLIFYLSLVIYLYIKEKINLQQAVFNTLTIFFISYITFFIINPFLWSAPIINTIKMIDHRFRILAAQKTIFPNQALNLLSQKIHFVLKRTLLSNGIYSNFNLEKWNGILEIPIDILLVLTSIYLHHKKKAKLKNLYRQTLLIWSLVFFVLTTLFIQLDWDHYYLPYIFIWSFLQSFVISYFCQQITIINFQQNKKFDK